jgi:hypothetical protein
MSKLASLLFNSDNKKEGNSQIPINRQLPPNLQIPMHLERAINLELAKDLDLVPTRPSVTIPKSKLR